MRLGSRRYINSTKVKRKVLFFIIVAVIIVILFLLLLSFFALRSSVTKMAKSRAKEIALTTINEAIAHTLPEDVSYSDFARFTYSAEGNVTSVENNLTKISKHSADLALGIGDAISGISKERISIPAGTLSGIDVLYGMGPDIPIDIKPYGNANAELTTRFYQAGINQTVFEVCAEVSVGISVLMPTIRTDQTIKTTVPVASTVIVGNVPESYTNVERHGFEYEDDVLELIE